MLLGLERKNSVIMKQKKLILIAVLFSAVISTKAQEAIPATGGEAGGSGGSVSYTVGQVIYATKTGTNGNSVAEGVQQPYEISVVTEIPEAEDIRLSVSAYPNSATDYFTVKVENYQTADLQYMVFDMNGRLLQQSKATGTKTKITTTNLMPAVYFVKVLENQTEIKVFKIIKK